MTQRLLDYLADLRFPYLLRYHYPGLPAGRFYP